MYPETSDTGELEMAQQAVLKQQLDTARATIIKLRATPNQITETEIRDAIESLQRAIEHWVRMIDKQLNGSRNNYGHIFLETFKPQHKDHEDDEDNKDLLSALKQFGTMDDSDNSQNRKWMLWLGLLNTCMHVVFCRGIWTCLEWYIFSMRYPVGVDSETGDTFTSIITAMEGKDGNGDERSCANRWKSETMTAYIKTGKFQDQKKDARSRILHKLDSLIITMLKNNVSITDQHTQALENDILEPALSLHQRMTCSSFSYRLETPRPIRGERYVDSKTSSWKFQDMVKWRPLDSENIGGVFQCLYPSIYRVGKTKKEDVLVCEATILAYDQGEGPRTTRDLLMTAPVTLHESLRESPQESPPGSPERYPQELTKLSTDDDRRRINTGTSDECESARNRRRYNTPSTPPTPNAVKPKHRGKFLDRFRTTLELSNPETAFDDDPSKSRSRSGPAKRGSSVEPDQPAMSRDFATKSKSQPSSRGSSYIATSSMANRELKLPGYVTASTRHESRHKTKHSDIDEEVLDRDKQKFYNERPKRRDPEGFERYLIHEESINSQRHG